MLISESRYGYYTCIINQQLSCILFIHGSDEALGTSLAEITEILHIIFTTQHGFNLAVVIRFSPVIHDSYTQLIIGSFLASECNLAIVT